MQRPRRFRTFFASALTALLLPASASAKEREGLYVAFDAGVAYRVGFYDVTGVPVGVTDPTATRRSERRIDFFSPELSVAVGDGFQRGIAFAAEAALGVGSSGYARVGVRSDIEMRRGFHFAASLGWEMLYLASAGLAATPGTLQDPHDTQGGPYGTLTLGWRGKLLGGFGRVAMSRVSSEHTTYTSESVAFGAELVWF